MPLRWYHVTTRDPSEPGDAWAAFCEYRDLPPSSRSLRRLVQPGRSITTLKRMSLRWRWQERIAAFDGVPSAPAPPRLASVIPLHGGGAEHPLHTDSETNTAGGADEDECADVCTGDLLDLAESALRRELGRKGAYTATELMKIGATARELASERRARELVDAQVDYDLSRLTDEEAETLTALCEKARVKRAGVA